MILFIVKMKALAAKRKELLQTLEAMSEIVRKEKGCRDYHFHQNREDCNAVTLIEEWETREDFNEHMGSDLFSVLLGAMSLLQGPPEIWFDRITFTVGMEIIRKVRPPAGITPPLRRLH
jgi:quinol monooxygenase YgiN